MTSITAELLIEQSEAIKLAIQNLEHPIRNIPFDTPEQLLALSDLLVAYHGIEQQLHRAIVLFQ
jgi:hypothetical protein